MTGAPDPRIVRVGETEIRMRTAEPEDRPRKRDVQWAVGWKDAPDAHRYWPEADADWQARHYFQEIVAEVDCVIAARIGLEAYRPPFAELVNLCVRPDSRRLGLGHMLTRAGQEEAARRGFRILFLQTEIDNLIAHRLYVGQDWVPTAHGKMLRMLKFLDYPLLTDFRNSHPLNQYQCTPVPNVQRAWNLEWHAYVTDDYLRLRLEGGASQSDSEGIGPALPACDWRIGQGARGLSLSLLREEVRDIEPGHHIAMEIVATNRGKRIESGVFQMILPPGLRVSSPTTNQTRAFLWQAAPNETVRQPVVIEVEPTFDAGLLWYLNYGSVPVSVEIYWEGHRTLLSASLPFAVPPPQS